MLDPKKILGPKRSLVRKKNVDPKNFKSEKKILGPKIFWVQKYFGSKNVLDP